MPLQKLIFEEWAKTFVKYTHLLKWPVAEILKITVNDIQEFLILNREIQAEAIGNKRGVC
jgi:hypothetical protein